MLDRFIEIYGNIYKYFISIEDRKTLSITVSPDKNIYVKVGYDVSNERIEKILKKRIDWINKQFKEIDKYKINDRRKDCISGESILYLGKQYKLIIKEYQLKEEVKLEKNQIIIFSHGASHNSINNEKILKNWYNKQSQKIFNRELKKMFSNFDHEFMPELSIMTMQNRWGSYVSRTNKIILNKELIKASIQCIDYVICHELCHIFHKKHDKNFYELISKIIPNWKILKEKLNIRFV